MKNYIPFLVVLVFLFLTGCASLNTLNKAVDRGALNKVKILVDGGADVNEIQPLYGTPLLIAVENEDVKMASLLLDLGADPHYMKQGEGPLISIAVLNRDADMVQLFVSHGVDVNKPIDFTLTMLQVFAGEGDLDTVHFLLENGADIAKGFPVSLAARGGHVEVAAFLISKGANISCPTRYDLFHGLSTIEQAVNSGSVEMVRLILATGVSPNCGNTMKDARFLGNNEITQALTSAGGTP